jgi:hypothetical protein
MHRYPRLEKIGVDRDGIEYPGDHSVFMNFWSFIWPESFEEAQHMDKSVLDLLVSSAARHPQKTPRIIWKTAARKILIKNPLNLHHYSIATARTGARRLAADLEALREQPWCLGMAEEDVVPHHYDEILFGDSSHDCVPYFNLMPWLVIENWQVTVYGCPAVLPAPYCHTLPGRKAIILNSKAPIWEKPTRRTPFPWTDFQWGLARTLIHLSIDVPDPFDYQALADVFTAYIGTEPFGAALDLLGFPLYFDLIREGRASIRAALAH